MESLWIVFESEVINDTIFFKRITKLQKSKSDKTERRGEYRAVLYTTL